VDEYLRVVGMDDVYALGDCACVKGHDAPCTAQVLSHINDDNGTLH
jgi:NADH dehydrogenase FAD-containing subunit